VTASPSRLSVRATARDVLPAAILTVLPTVGGVVAWLIYLHPVAWALFGFAVVMAVSGVRTAFGRVDVTDELLTVRTMGRTHEAVWFHVKGVESGAGLVQQSILVRRLEGRPLLLPVPRGVRGATAAVDRVADQLRDHLTDRRWLVVQKWHPPRLLVAGVVLAVAGTIALGRPWQWYPRSSYDSLPAVCDALGPASVGASRPVQVPQTGAADVVACRWNTIGGPLTIAMHRYNGRGVTTGRMAAIDALNDKSTYWRPIVKSYGHFEVSLGADVSVERLWYPKRNISDEPSPWGDYAVGIVTRQANVLIVLTYTATSEGMEIRSDGFHWAAADDAQQWVREALATLTSCCPLD
jgi:hypothetical protein